MSDLPLITKIYYAVGAVSGTAEGIGRSLSRSPVKNRTTSVSMEDPPRKEAASVAPPRLYSSSDGTVTPPPTPSLSVGGSGLGIPPSAAAPLGAAAPSAAPVDVSALYDEAFRGSPRRATSLRSNGGGGGSSEDGSRSPPSGRAAAASAARRKLEFSDGDGGGAGATGAASSSD